MAVTPGGSITPQFVATRQLIANTAAFQAWTGAAGAAGALPRVHGAYSLPYIEGEYTPQQVIDTRPCCIVNLFPNKGWMAQRAGSDGFLPMGMFLAEFQDTVPVPGEEIVDTAQFYLDSFLTFMNNFGAVLEQVIEVAESGGYPYLQRVFTHKSIARIDPELRESQGDYHFAYAVFQWGLSVE